MRGAAGTASTFAQSRSSDFHSPAEASGSPLAADCLTVSVVRVRVRVRVRSEKFLSATRIFVVLGAFLLIQLVVVQPLHERVIFVVSERDMDGESAVHGRVTFKMGPLRVVRRTVLGNIHIFSSSACSLCP